MASEKVDTIKVISLVISLLVLAQVLEAQESNPQESEKPYTARLQKSRYLLSEPIVVEFRWKTPTPARLGYRVLQETGIKVSFKGKTHEFPALTSIVTTGGGVELPSVDRSNYNLYLGGLIAGGHPPPPPPKYLEQKEIIDIALDFFPESGNYQIQFVYGGVSSNVIDLTIKEPTGINRAAFEFLSKHQEATSFYWVWEEKNGIALLEVFVAKYRRSVYGDLAISHLAGIYLAKGDLDMAKAEFEKIKSSKNPVIAKEANTSLADIAKRKSDVRKLQKEENQKQNAHASRKRRH